MAIVKKPKTAEINPGPGFRVRKQFSRLPVEIMKGLGEFDTPAISDLMNRLYTMNPAIHNLSAPEKIIAGPACTVRVYPGDNMMVHKVLDVAAPGDIVVIDAGGSHLNAVLGDLVSNKAKFRGIQAFVIDGFVRDLPGIQEIHLPVFARGVTPIGPLHRGPGEINFPIQCGGIVVNPGDVIVGDTIGVVVIPREIATDLLERLIKHRDTEAEYCAAVKRGEFSNEWVDTFLKGANCEYIEGTGE